MFVFQKRLFSFVLFAALAGMHAGALCAQWVQTNGPEGGSVFSIALCGTNIFVATGTGVSISTDNGASWKPVNSGLPTTRINALAAIGSNLFAATGTSVFLSTDSGLNWTIVSKKLPTVSVSFLASNNTSVFAANDFEIFRSSNFGNTWDSISLPPITGSYITAFAVSGTSILVGTDGGAILSNDNGSHWKGLGGGITSALALIGTDIYVGGEGNYVQGGNIYRSTDSGLTWSNPVNLPQQVFVTAFAAFGSFVFAGTDGSGALFSTDRGVTWNATDSGMPATSIFSFTQNGTNLFAGTEGGVFRTTDSGIVWTQVNSELRSSNVTAFASSGKNLLVSTYGNGVFLSTNGGSNWTAIDGNNENQDVEDLVLSGTNLFTAGPTGVFRSSNEGANWAIVDSGVQYHALAVIGTTIFDGWGFEHEGGVYFGGVDKSSDGGSSWSATGIGGEEIEWLAAGGGILCAGGTYPEVISADTGATWNQPIWNAPFYATIFSLASLDTNILAGTDEGLFISKNHGESWDSLGTSLPRSQNNPIYSILTIHGNIFAASYGAGVFRSTDNGLTWTSINDGLTNLIAYALFTDGASLFIGIDGAGVWRRSLSDFGISSVAQTPEVQPTILSYPNPFSHSTEISFTSEAAGYADVSVVNLLGAEVAHLFSGELAAGEHSVVWSKSPGLPDGMYECLVRMNGRVETLPVVLDR